MKLGLIISGSTLLLASVVLLVVGLNQSTPQPTADLLFAIREWTTIFGSLFLAAGAVWKPRLTKTEIILIPLVAIGIWVGASLIMVFIASNLFSSRIIGK